MSSLRCTPCSSRTFSCFLIAVAFSNPMSCFLTGFGMIELLGIVYRRGWLSLLSLLPATGYYSLSSPSNIERDRYCKRAFVWGIPLGGGASGTFFKGAFKWFFISSSRMLILWPSMHRYRMTEKPFMGDSVWWWFCSVSLSISAMLASPVCFIWVGDCLA